MAIAEAATRTKNVLLNVRELADLYALKTLYDYLAPRKRRDGLELNLFFGGSIHSERSREVLASAPSKETIKPGSIDLVVGCFSDIFVQSDLSIDIAVLKNSVVPISDEEKARLRQKYEVPSDKPVLVVSYTNDFSEVADIVKSAAKHANVYLIGFCSLEKINLPKKVKRNIHVVSRIGVLKDYYALADAAVNGHNVSPSSSQLHNFVEATEGGPLFMVPSTKSAQYGYRQLVDAGVVVECRDANDIANKVTLYLRGCNGNAQIAAARRAHLKHTREKYLPVILAHMEKLLGSDVEIPDSDLKVVSTGTGTRLLHPESSWESMLINANIVEWNTSLIQAPVFRSGITPELIEVLQKYNTSIGIKDGKYNQSRHAFHKSMDWDQASVIDSDQKVDSLQYLFSLEDLLPEASKPVCIKGPPSLNGGDLTTLLQYYLGREASRYTPENLAHIGHFGAWIPKGALSSPELIPSRIEKFHEYLTSKVA